MPSDSTKKLNFGVFSSTRCFLGSSSSSSSLYEAEHTEHILSSYVTQPRTTKAGYVFLLHS